jgi:PAS domain-containing protein
LDPGIEMITEQKKMENMKKGKGDLKNSRTLREEAEKLLKKKREMIALPVLESDEEKLIHELQVHQVALEIQNEELRAANQIAEKALRNYTMLYDLAPMGYFTLESDGTICELNFTAADMLGEKRFSLINTNLKIFLSRESLPVFNQFLSKVFTSKVKETCNVHLSQVNNNLFQVYMEAIETGEDRRCLLSVVDISRIKLM